jgi:hypothetical protein
VSNEGNSSAPNRGRTRAERTASKAVSPSTPRRTLTRLAVAEGGDAAIHGCGGFTGCGTAQLTKGARVYTHID